VLVKLARSLISFGLEKAAVMISPMIVSRKDYYLEATKTSEKFVFIPAVLAKQFIDWEFPECASFNRGENETVADWFDESGI